MDYRSTLTDRQAIQFRLDFYEEDIIATTFGPTAISYRIEEKDLATAFSSDRFSMILPQNTVWVAQRGARHAIAMFVPAARYALFVSYGEENLSPFNIPLPPLLFSVAWKDQRVEVLHLLALKSNTFPTPNDRLCVAPLPNVNAFDGRVCLGSLRFGPQSLPGDASSIFQLVMASPFSNHDLSKKSKQYPENLLFAWHALHDERRAEYPLEDLVETSWTVRTYLDPDSSVNS